MQGNQIPIFQYVVIEVPPQAQVERELAAEGVSKSAQAFAARMNLLAAEGKAIQVINYPGFVLVGAMTATMLMEQTIMPGIFPGGAPPAANRR